MDPVVLLVVLVTAFVTMFVGAISGGVGLVLRPVLVFLGYPATTIVGTARASSYVGDLPGLLILNRKKHIEWKLVAFLAVPIFIGGLLAAYVTLTLLEHVFNVLFAVVLILAGIALATSKTDYTKVREARFTPGTRHTVSFFGTMAIAFFGTISGGLGPLSVSFYLWLYGKEFIGTAATWRAASYIGTGFATIAFVVGGVIDWQLWLVLSVGIALGSYFGTHHGLRKGEAWVRFVVLIVVFGTAIKLLFF